jgi:hypothetical protein
MRRPVTPLNRLLRRHHTSKLKTGRESDCAGVAFRFVPTTPPAGGRRQPLEFTQRRAVLDTAESPTAAESTPLLSRTAILGSGREVVEVDAVPAKLLLDQRPFVVGVDVRGREKRSAQSKKRLDSAFNVAADPIRVSAAHQARTRISLRRRAHDPQARSAFTRSS